MDIQLKLQDEFGAKAWQVQNTVKLLDDGNTVPFIARYRKEATGELDDQLLRKFSDRLTYLRGVEERKQEVLRLIDEQGKLTDELAGAINAAEKLQEIEDLYRPYRQKRRTRATVAKERGLLPLSELIMEQTLMEGDIDEICAEYITEDVATTQDALNGAMDIIAETISDDADFRKFIREYTFENGTISSRGEGNEVYAIYFEYAEPIKKAVNHRILAIDRGEREGVLKVSIDAEEEPILQHLRGCLAANPRSITTEYVELAASDSYGRLIKPSLEREIRNELTDRAQEGAIEVFSANLKNLLLQQPVKGRIVLGFDPAYRTGCKLAVVDDTGRVLDIAVVYPHQPVNRETEAATKIKALMRQHKINLVAIGNGTASKESEIFIAKLLREIPEKVQYTMVSESGASVYSASVLAAEEFPDFDVSERSAVSIARRVQDPLAELVKIDPKAIGVGQYQHDMNQKRLGEALGGVVEDCVNSVGVDLNTASPSLLSYVAGVNSAIAKNIVVQREENGKFTSRTQLKKVPKLGSKAFLQCAGFLRILDGKNVLDATAVHPESYAAAEKFLAVTGYAPMDERLREAVTAQMAEKCGVGLPTLRDIAEELLKPGRDPRDSLPQPQLLEDVLDMKDLKAGMVLTGPVRNVADFGAFVDIGVHQDGLVHISQLSDKFVKRAMDVVSVGDIVKVRVLDIDSVRGRISLSMTGV